MTTNDHVRAEKIDLAQEATNLLAILRYMEDTNARRFDPSRVAMLIGLVKDRLENASRATPADSALDPAAVEGNAPDFLYDPDDWEMTYLWGDRHDAADHAEVSGRDVKRFRTLVRGPDKFCASIPMGEPDEGGDYDDWEYRFFNSEEAARLALAREAAE